MDYKQLPDGRWRRQPSEPAVESVRCWYMRDNHTFRPLPLDTEAALAAMREERDGGQTYGLLCGRPHGVVPEPVHAADAARWPEFEALARKWLDKTVALSKPPNAGIQARP